MTVAVLAMTDGRADCISQAIPSLEANVTGPITRRIIHDDSGDPDYRDWLRQEFPGYYLIFHPQGRQGFGGAYRNAWRFLTGVSEQWIFSTEDDFTFTQPVSLDPLVAILDANPDIAQVALLRQPWSDEEQAAGGIIQQHPSCYYPVATGEVQWLRHRRFFTTNPNLHRRSLCLQGWPDVENSEGMFSIDLFSDPKVACAFYGDGEVMVTHIGAERVGSGY